jgi:hypothetical protein
MVQAKLGLKFRLKSAEKILVAGPYPIQFPKIVLCHDLSPGPLGKSSRTKKIEEKDKLK